MQTHIVMDLHTQTQLMGQALIIIVNPYPSFNRSLCSKPLIPEQPLFKIMTRFFNFREFYYYREVYFLVNVIIAQIEK